MKKLIAGIAFVAVIALVAVAGTAQAATFTQNLTIGSTGAEVVALQTMLESKGHLVMPAGVSKGYFGALTQSAVAKYQMAKGITPAVGYVGPITRAALNAEGTVVTPGNDCPAGAIYNPVTGAKCGTTQPPVTGGEEGQLINIDNASADVESSLNENDEDVKVFGAEVEAEDSDISVDRIDVDFTLTDAANGSDNLDDYITEVSLYQGDKKLATQDVDEADVNDGSTGDDLTDDDNDVYSFRFTGLKAMVAEGDTSEFYVAVSAVSNVDTADAGDEWAVVIPDDGIRAVDGAGISETYVDNGDLSEENFSIDEAEAGDVSVTAKESDNPDRIVTVDADVATDDEEVLVFTIESDSSTNNVDSIEIDLATTTSTSTAFTSVISRLHLLADGKEVGTESITNNANGSATAVFDNLDMDIDENDEVEFTVTADFKKDADQREGFSFQAAVDVSALDIEDAEGDNVTVTGSDRTGGEIELRTNGISVEYVSSKATVQTATITGNADSVDAEIVFKVTNNGDDDIYIDGDILQGVIAPTTSTDGLTWATTTQSNTGTSTYTAILDASGDDDNDDLTASQISYFVGKGESRTFTFTVNVPTGTDNGALGVRITGIKWDTDAGDAHANLYDFDLGDLKTPTRTGLQVR